jgi:hypothetical protein
MTEKPPTLLRAAQCHWRSFAAIWIAPVFMLVVISVGERIGHPGLSWWLLALPFAAWSFLRSSRPWLAGRIRYLHQFLLGILIPFVIAVVAMRLLALLDV